MNKPWLRPFVRLFALYLAWMAVLAFAPITVSDMIGGTLGMVSGLALLLVLFAVHLKFRGPVTDWILSGCPRRKQWTEDSL